MVDILLQKIKENCTNVDLDIVNKAFNLAYEAHKEQKRESGEPYIIHPIDVAVILADHTVHLPSLSKLPYFSKDLAVISLEVNSGSLLFNST